MTREPTTQSAGPSWALITAFFVAFFFALHAWHDSTERRIERFERSLAKIEPGRVEREQRLAKMRADCEREPVRAFGGAEQCAEFIAGREELNALNDESDVVHEAWLRRQIERFRMQ